MNIAENTAENPSSPVRTRRPLPWLLIIGLASLVLLWPLTSQWQFGQGLPRAAALLGLTAVVWIGVVGVGRVPRPVLTLGCCTARSAWWWAGSCRAAGPAAASPRCG